MFHPTRLRVDLPMLARAAIQAAALFVVKQRFRRGRALVDGEDVLHSLSHNSSSVD
jgi:hypothetical protein